MGKVKDHFHDEIEARKDFNEPDFLKHTLDSLTLKLINANKDMSLYAEIGADELQVLVQVVSEAKKEKLRQLNQSKPKGKANDDTEPPF